MPVIMEVIHTVRPATPKKFEEYVLAYGETAVPMMQACGFDILGGWKWSTGQIGRDLLVISFESMAHYETASAQLFKRLMKGGLEPLQALGLEIQEQVKFANPLPYATDERLTAVIDTATEQPRQYLYARLKASLANQQQAFETVGKLVSEVAGHGMKLATAYATTSGERGEFADIWVLEKGLGDLSFRTGAPDLPRISELYDLVDFEALDYINPLPYSKLQ